MTRRYARFILNPLPASGKILPTRLNCSIGVRGERCKKREINPTEWLQAFNISHGIEVTGGQRGLYLSGQTANAADGSAMHPGDLVAQFRLAWSNVKDSLAVAGMDPSNIVRLNMYTTDVDGFMAAAGEIVPS